MSDGRFVQGGDSWQQRASKNWAAAVDKQAAPDANLALQPLKDPVCGMAVTEQSEHHQAYSGKPYYFCSAGCQTKFKAHPGHYTAAKPVDGTKSSAPAMLDQQPSLAGTMYTCPMHPEIRQSAP
eukprot:gene301-362_t